MDDPPNVTSLENDYPEDIYIVMDPHEYIPPPEDYKPKARKKRLAIPPHQPDSQSQFFIEAEKRAQVPFVHHKLLECDCRGQKYTIKDHDITLKISEGAIPVGKKIHFEIAVAMYGPFKFPENTQPISPILWLCLKENSALSIPFQVIFPHFLIGLTKEKAQYHQIVFAKADHNKYFIEDGWIKYSFQPCGTKPYFASSENRSFGVLLANHCCSYCLQANQTQELAMDAGYCLARIESFISQQRSEVYFSVVYFLSTCLKVRCQENYWRLSLRKFLSCNNSYITGGIITIK